MPKIAYSLRSLWLFCLTTTAIMGVYFLSDPWVRTAQIKLPETAVRYTRNVLLSEMKDQIIFSIRNNDHNVIYGINLDDFNIAWSVPTSLGVSHLFRFDNNILILGKFGRGLGIFGISKINVLDGSEEVQWSTHSAKIIRAHGDNVLVLNMLQEIVMASCSGNTWDTYNMNEKLEGNIVHEMLPSKKYGKFLVYSFNRVYVINSDNTVEYDIDVFPERRFALLIDWDEEKNHVLLIIGGLTAGHIKLLDINSGKYSSLHSNVYVDLTSYTPIRFGEKHILMWTPETMFFLNTENFSKSPVFYRHSLRDDLFGFPSFTADTFGVDINEMNNYMAYIEGENNVVLHDLKTHEVLWKYQRHGVRLVKCIDKDAIIIGLADGTIEKWKRKYPPGWSGQLHRAELWFAILLFVLLIFVFIQSARDQKQLSDKLRRKGGGMKRSFVLIAIWTFALYAIGCGKTTPSKLSLDLGDGVKLELVLIPAGKFMMGSPECEHGRNYDGSIQQETVKAVTIGKPFYMGKYEVTQAQYEKIMGENPSKYRGESNLPVESVSWHKAVEFCQRVSQIVGKTVRLPTESEWEYACRAGTTTRFYSGNSDIKLANTGWFSDNSNNKTHPVGRKTPNAWGIYDMHGNVMEWCQDLVPASERLSGWRVPARIVRGGGFLHGPWHCRSASRDYGEEDQDAPFLGFRVVIVAAVAAQKPVNADSPVKSMGNEENHEVQEEEKK
jgi:formylglycine-generating enzyme required for sulfatase activity